MKPLPSEDVLEAMFDRLMVSPNFAYYSIIVILSNMLLYKANSVTLKSHLKNEVWHSFYVSTFFVTLELSMGWCNGVQWNASM